MLIRLLKLSPLSPACKIQLVGGGFCIVDEADFAWLNKFCWRRKKNHSGFYAYTRKQVKGKTHYVYMHRLICKTPTWLKTHHINHNGLDNRRENLSVITEREHRHFDGWHYFEQ